MSHETFTLTRAFRARPEMLWQAWSDPALKRRWFADNGGPAWETLDYKLDFRVGGLETGRFRFIPDGASDIPSLAGIHENVTHYLEIAEGARIVTAYTMALDGVIHSASLVSIGFEGTPEGSRLTLTETMHEIGRTDGVEGRKGGTSWLLDQLEKVLKEWTS